MFHECSTSVLKPHRSFGGIPCPQPVLLFSATNCRKLKAILITLLDVVFIRYKTDLMFKKKKLVPGKSRSDGDMTEKLAAVIKSLWSGSYSSEVSSEFKSTVDKYAVQYRGGSQHDAQEFLLWLLDKVHEDLNVAKKKRYKHVKVRDG